jgi:hypothetical protein
MPRALRVYLLIFSILILHVAAFIGGIALMAGHPAVGLWLTGAALALNITLGVVLYLKV